MLSHTGYTTEIHVTLSNQYSLTHLIKGMCPKFMVIECLLLFCDINFPIGGLKARIFTINYTFFFIHFVDAHSYNIQNWHLISVIFDYAWKGNAHVQILFFTISMYKCSFVPKCNSQFFYTHVSVLEILFKLCYWQNSPYAVENKEELNEDASERQDSAHQNAGDGPCVEGLVRNLAWNLVGAHWMLNRLQNDKNKFKRQHREAGGQSILT